MTRVAVAGAAGRVGQTVCAAVEAAEDLELSGRADPALGTPVEAVLDGAEVMVDFTTPGTAVDNVRAALALVATGEAPYGIVYATDAAAEPRVRVVGTFAADTHDPITYPVALLASAQDPADRAFLDALSAPPADAVFAAQGFAVLK